MPSGASGSPSIRIEPVCDIRQLAGMLAEEMVVVRRIGVEIGLGAFDRDLAQQARPVNWCSVL